MKYSVFFFLMMFAFLVKGQESVLSISEFKVRTNDTLNVTLEANDNVLYRLFAKKEKTKQAGKKKNKFVASALAIALGPFGVHRLYLGTDAKVPLAYTLTLGGGFFVLPLIDIIYILSSKDPENIEHNKYFFIWNKRKKKKEIK